MAKITNSHFSEAQGLLISSVTKLLLLRENPAWREQLPTRCPPILWFGNSKSRNPNILTIGANPSRREFLSDSSNQAIQKYQRTKNDSLLSYLEPPHNRFRLLRQDEVMQNILENEDIQKEIIASYDQYFFRSHNPYRQWFGANKNDSYNVEGFLRGLGATYYEDANERYQTLHIDLFPFATLADFHELLDLAERDLFHTEWARELVTKLIQLHKAEALIVFGRTNLKYFGKYIDQAIRGFTEYSFDSARFFFGRSKLFGLPILGLSTNLGNPKGFSAIRLRQYGRYIHQKTGFPGLNVA